MLMKGKAYLSMGGTSMGIAGSMVDYGFWEKWLGMRVEDIDMSEFIGRMNKGQYDQGWDRIRDARNGKQKDIGLLPRNVEAPAAGGFKSQVEEFSRALLAHALDRGEQRIAIARALINEPDLILADEPTANLDARTTFGLLDIMQQLNEKEGTTFIFSTHDARVVKKARRVITVEDGKVISDERKK